MEDTVTVTVRLPSQLAKQLEARAESDGQTRSELIRDSLYQYLGNSQPRPTPWELGHDPFGTYGSGQGNLSTDCEMLIREKVHARKGAR